MNVTELTDAYSDDMLYLLDLDKMIESQPGGNATPDFIKYSCCCRLWATMMVGTFEMVVKSWGQNDVFWRDIMRYLKDGRSDNRSNRDRVDSLQKAIQTRGLKAQMNDFDDLLAIIYIRNAYVHGKWIPAQAKYVEARGFPSDLMKFSKDNFERMKSIYSAVLTPLGASMIISPTNRRN